MHVVDEDGVGLLNSSLLLRTLAGHIVGKAGVSIHLAPDCTHVVIVFRVKTASDA